jgi:hypothetical protein
MIPLVEFPELVQHYAHFFEPVFSKGAFIQFQRYISGLIVSENKTIEGINRLFVHELRHQSSLNRLLTDYPFGLEQLNTARLTMLASLAETRLKRRGVLSLDDTLLSHYGQHFEQIAYLYDSAQKRYSWAHNLVNLHYSDDQTDYPIAFRLWQPADLAKLEQGLPTAGLKLRPSKFALKQEDPKKWRQYLLGVWRRHQQQPAVASLYQSKLLIGQQLLQQWVQQQPELKLPVTFDTWYTQPAFCRFLDQKLQLPYVGTLTNDQELTLKSGRISLEAFATRLQTEHQQAVQNGERPVFKQITIPYKGTKERYYSYCRTHRIHNFGKQRLVINHRQADLTDKPVYYLSNRLAWQAPGITRIRRHRWPVEVYHEEGKAEGLDQYQLRDFEGITRHVALIAVVYSLLRAAQHDTALRNKLQRQLKVELEGSVGFWQRATQAQSLWSLALFISSGLVQGQDLSTLMAPLIRTICAR